MKTRLFALGLASVLLIEGRSQSAIASAETTPEVQSANVETPRREPIVGLGYHPGNFIGPLAFDPPEGDRRERASWASRDHRLHSRRDRRR